MIPVNVVRRDPSRTLTSAAPRCGPEELRPGIGEPLKQEEYERRIRRGEGSKKRMARKAEERATGFTFRFVGEIKVAPRLRTASSNHRLITH